MRTSLVANLFGPLLLTQLVVLVTLVAVRREQALAWAVRHRWVIALAVGSAVAYALVLAWWVPQADGWRFVAAFVLPLSAASSLGIERLGRGVRIGREWTAADVAFAGLLAAIVAASLAAPALAGHWYGGA